MLDDSTNISGPPTRRVTGSEGLLRVLGRVTSDPEVDHVGHVRTGRHLALVRSCTSFIHTLKTPDPLSRAPESVSRVFFNASCQSGLCLAWIPSNLEAKGGKWKIEGSNLRSEV